jgi:hypothetical protein
MVLCYALPNKTVVKNIDKSIETLEYEGLYPRKFGNSEAVQLDNFTDAWMLNIASTKELGHPVKSAFENPFLIAENGSDKVKNLSLLMKHYNNTDDYKDVYRAAKDGNSTSLQYSSYSRYWHGYLIVLKPLLSVFSYDSLRIVNTIAMTAVLITVMYLLDIKIGTRYALAFFASMMSIRIFIAPFSIQFSNMFYMTLFSMIGILSFYEWIRKRRCEYLVFFAIGACTSFFDLLTFPLLPIGAALTTYVLLSLNNSKNISVNNLANNSGNCLENSLKNCAGSNSSNCSENVSGNNSENNYGLSLLWRMIEVLKLSVIWTVGYGLTWASKWVLASVLLNENVVKRSIEQIFLRTSAETSDQKLTMYGVIRNNVVMPFGVTVLKLLICIAVIWVIVMIMRRRKYLLDVLPILMVSIYPIVWYAVLKNHSFIHSWFTYRDLGVSIFAVLSAMAYSVGPFLPVRTKINH